MAKQTFRVVVADDHPMWVEAISRDLALAGHTVVASVNNGQAAVEAAVQHRPDVMVLDLNMPMLNGTEVCAKISVHELPTHVLILSASAEESDVLQAVKFGACGYLLKSATREEFVGAVEATARGESVFTPGLAGLVLQEYRRMSKPSAGTAPHPELTARETEVLQLVATGMTYKEIASMLFLSHRTVQNHVQNTLGKLQLHNRVELVRYAISMGLSAQESERG